MIGSTRLVLAVTVAVGALAGGVRAARAQDAAAEVLFRDGDRLMGEGKYAEACAAFEASNRVEPRAGTLIRLGDCREKNQQLASAWSAYSDALARAKDPQKKQVAQGKIASLEPRLSTLTVAVATPVAGLAIQRGDAPIDAALWGRPVPIDGGVYTLRASALGFEAWTTTVTVPTEGGVVSVDVPVLQAQPDPITAHPVVDPAPIAPAVAPDRGGGGLSGKRKLALGLGAGGVALIGAGVLFGLSAGSLEDEAQAACPMPVCDRADVANDALARARTRANLANLSYGVGGAAIAAAGVLWYLGRSSGEHAVAVVPTGAGAAVAGRF